MSSLDALVFARRQLLLISELALIRRRQRRRERIYRRRVAFMDMSPPQILQIYRLDAEAITHLMDEIGEELTSRSNNQLAIPPLVKLLCVLHFCASGSFQGTVAMANGISQPAFSQILTQVIKAMLRRASKYIYFPETRRALAKVKSGFYALAPLPNVVGALDCTHFRLVPPAANEQVFRNRKSQHSINGQAVCDSDLVFTHCCFRFPGSSHDSMILQSSCLPRVIESLPQRPPSWLLGDSGYALSAWLLTPYRNPVGQPQESYNAAHIRARNCIERSFGLLKSRFRCLHGTGGALMYSPDKVCKIALLCAILHNIARRRKIPLPEGFEDAMDEGDGLPEEQPGEGEMDHVQGIRVRESVVQRYFSV